MLHRHNTNKQNKKCKTHESKSKKEPRFRCQTHVNKTQNASVKNLEHISSKHFIILGAGCLHKAIHVFEQFQRLHMFSIRSFETSHPFIVCECLYFPVFKCKRVALDAVLNGMTEMGTIVIKLLIFTLEIQECG